jgi:hypothetical protein
MICEASLLSQLKLGVNIHPILNVICKKSVRHVLGLRSHARHHHYDLPKIVYGKYPDTFIEEHNVKSLAWSIIQAQKIDIIGCDKWLNSEDAIFGYYDNSNNKKIICTDDSDTMKI